MVQGGLAGRCAGPSALKAVNAYPLGHLFTQEETNNPEIGFAYQLHKGLGGHRTRLANRASYSGEGRAANLKATIARRRS